MVENRIPSGLTEKDELLHHPTKEKKWRESYYFNWLDLNNKISGFSTIGLVPNEKRREFVFLLFMEDTNEVYYREPELINFNDNLEEMLKDKRLSYTLSDPYKMWKLQYISHKLRFEITFETRFPTYNFGLDSSASWHQHFEASGIIKGIIEFKEGKKIYLSGYGQRDKSWGFRDWHQFEKWYAGHFQFKEWSASFRKDYYGENIDLSGHVSNKKSNISLSKMNVNTINDSDSLNSPISATYEFEDKEGNSYQIASKRMTDRSYIRFVRNFQGGFTELFEQMVIIENLNTGEIGSGMMEHLRTIYIS
jgi:hypothetical protein